MPIPPPPPPPGPPPPPALPAFGGGGKSPGKAADPNSRNQLLKSIQQGARLKKAVTNDRSAPIVDGKSIRD
jgi:WAS/WASL-interacting protein